MDTLSKDWITEGTLDFEYKKYILLAYLQHCHGSFEKKALYPPLAELIEHHRNLVELNNSLHQWRQSFPRNLSGLDVEKASLIYESAVPEDQYFSTVTEIVDYAIPTLKETLEEGRQVYEEVEQHIEVTPLGVIPVYRDEGYLLVQPDLTDEVSVYNYRLSAITGLGQTFRALEMNWIYNDKRSIAHTYESIKRELIHRFTQLPNPATFLCRSRGWLPLKETILPVTRRVLMKQLVTYTT
jgi:hypothetical protein